MAECHQWCNERELGQISGDDEGQGGLAFCSPWDCKESDTTGQTTPIHVHIYIYIHIYEKHQINNLNLNIFTSKWDTQSIIERFYWASDLNPVK